MRGRSLRANVVTPALARRGLVGRALALGLAAGSMRLAAQAATSPGSTAATSTAAPSAAATPATTGAAPSAATLTAFAECSVVTADEATRLLGYDVLPPDTTARAGGDCFFVSQSMSEDGSVSYSLVTAARLAKLRPYFIAMARRCAGVQPSSARAAPCALYVKLAGVTDLDAYYAARTTLTDAAPVAGGLGEGSSGAVSAGGTLFVRAAGIVVEAAFERDGTFDLERSEALARLLLERLLGRAPVPSPSGV
jgi:hypothetical protein